MPAGSTAIRTDGGFHEKGCAAIDAVPLVGDLVLSGSRVLDWIPWWCPARDTNAKLHLTDTLNVAKQSRYRLRAGGAVCYGYRSCVDADITDASVVRAMRELVDRESSDSSIAEWDPALPKANTVYVQVDPSSLAANHNAVDTNEHNGIAGNPDRGDWIRLAIRSHTGATFCAVVVADTSAAQFEGTGFMSVNAADSDDVTTSAHCGGVASLPVSHHVTSTSCVYGAGSDSVEELGDATTFASRDSGLLEFPIDGCATRMSLGKPGDYPL